MYEGRSGAEALEVLKGSQVDMILSDINMPVMDGLEFLRQLKAQNLAPGVPVIMITTESRRGAREAGDSVRRGGVISASRSRPSRSRNGFCRCLRRPEARNGL